MWTTQNRRRYDRSALRYPSDLTDDEWAYVEPLIPPARRGGNKRHVDVREVMNGLKKLFADGGYQGPEFQKALKSIVPHLGTEIVKRSDQAKGFVVLPRRWVVERTMLGSTAAEGLPRIGRTSTARRWRSYASHQSASCSENFGIPPDVSGQTLRARWRRVRRTRIAAVYAKPCAPISTPTGHARFGWMNPAVYAAGRPTGQC